MQQRIYIFLLSFLVQNGRKKTKSNLITSIQSAYCSSDCQPRLRKKSASVQENQPENSFFFIFYLNYFELQIKIEIKNRA